MEKIGTTTCASRPRSLIMEVSVNTVIAVFDEDCRLSVRQLEEFLYIPKTTIHQILKDELQMRLVFLSWVSHFLISDQLQQCLNACDRNLALITEDPDFLQKVIMEESWVHYCNLRV